MTGDISATTLAIALGLTALTALSTCIGSLLAFLPGTSDRRFISVALGLSAGVMVYVALTGILPESIEKLGRQNALWAVVAFTGGMGLMAVLDMVLPEHGGCRHTPDGKESCGDSAGSAQQRRRLRRTGLILASTIAVHNFPEGMATFVSALGGLDVALPLALAICIHNVPMGIAMAAPVYYGTCSRRKAFFCTFFSGMAAVAGAVVALLFLLPWWTPQLESLCMAAVAGVMLFIAFDELLPEAEAYGRHSLVIAGLVAGVALMAFCLLLFGHNH